MKTEALTHKQLVNKAALWLRNNQNCSVVICERATRVSETPDCLGFAQGSISILIEAKTSRSDFLADKNKWVRKSDDRGVGDKRFYFCPPGVVTAADDLNGWGLIELVGNRCYVQQPAEFKPANKANEVAMLVSMVRRLEIAGAVFVRHEPQVEAHEAD